MIQHIKTNRYMARRLQLDIHLRLLGKENISKQVLNYTQGDGDV